MSALEGLTVLDFSTLLPGPLAGLILAEAGATIIKVERPSGGDEMRSYHPRIDDDSVNFLMLNRGKQSLAIDLKAADAIDRLRPLIERADVLIEQFRPGVMDRLGLGYEQVHALNPRIVYCSITGWGQTGPKANKASHDLNYIAETGLLGLSADAAGTPVLPPMLAADIAGGALPAAMNIMFSLWQRERTGEGAHLDISMADNLFAFSFWGIGSGLSGQGWPKPGAELFTGGSPRYQIYATADGRYVAAAPIEDKFWAAFTRIIELPDEFRDPAADPGRVLLQSGRRCSTARTCAARSSPRSKKQSPIRTLKHAGCSRIPSALVRRRCPHCRFRSRPCFAARHRAGPRRRWENRTRRCSTATRPKASHDALHNLLTQPRSRGVTRLPLHVRHRQAMSASRRVRRADTNKAG